MNARFVGWIYLCTVVSILGCATPDPEPRSSSAQIQSALSSTGPTADLCGTWEAVELSATSPAPPASSHGNGVAEIDSTHTFCQPITVQVPASLQVIGSAAQDPVTLTFDNPAGDVGSASITCRYAASSATATSYDFVNCNKGVQSGGTVQGQTFTLALKYHTQSASHGAQVVLGNGSPPPADAYRQYLGTTPNLSGVVLQVPADGATPFSGIGLADGFAFQPHAFVAQPPSGALIAGPSVQVVGPSSLGQGVTLTVPFDSAWVASLPPGSLATVALQQVSSVSGGLEAMNATPLTGATVGTSTLTVGLSTSGQYVTSIADLTPLTNHGGPVMNAGVNVYIIWVGDFGAMAAADDPRATLRRFIGDLPSSPWYGILSTYGITNSSLTLAGELSRTDLSTINDPYGDVVAPAIAPGGAFPADANGIYLVVPASGVTISDKNYCSQYCGYHTLHDGSSTIKYAFIGSPPACKSGCTFGGSTVNGATVDSVLTVVAHEIAESVTDPEISAWYGYVEGVSSQSAVENADKCNWITHSVQGTTGTPSLLYDLTVNAHQYYIQSLWVNAESGYCGMGIESVSIAASPPPQPLAVSEVGTFQVTVTNTGPVYMDTGEYEIIGWAAGSDPTNSVPFTIFVGIPAGQSVTVDVPVQAPAQVTGNVQPITFEFEVRDPRNLHTFPAIGQTIANVQIAATLVNQAACVGLSLPSSIGPGQCVTVTATFQNAGTTDWVGGGPYSGGEYQVVGLPLDFDNGYLQEPQVLSATYPPGTQATVSFSACAPSDYGGQFTVDVEMANPAAAFGSDCKATAQIQCASTAGSACGPAQCGGTAMCDGTCDFQVPPSLGNSCDSLGGTTQCNGNCCTNACWQTCLNNCSSGCTGESSSTGGTSPDTCDCEGVLGPAPFPAPIGSSGCLNGG